MHRPSTDKDEWDHESIHQAVDKAAENTDVDLRDDATLIVPAPLSARASEAGSLASVFQDLNVCPRCGAKLSETLQLGWCQHCGYCRHLERARASQAMAQADRLSLSWSQRILVFFIALRQSLSGGDWDMPVLRKKRPLDGPVQAPGGGQLEVLPRSGELLPEWLSVLVCGLVVCAVGSMTAGLNLRGENRALLIWSAGEASLGATLVLAAQVWIFLHIVPVGSRRKYARRFWSPRLWVGAWQRLPATRWPVWTVVWGMGLCVFALCIHLMCG